MISACSIHEMTKQERHRYEGAEGKAYMFTGTDGTFKFEAVCDDSGVTVIFWTLGDRDVAAVQIYTMSPLNQFIFEGIHTVAKRTRSTIEFLAVLNNHGFDVNYDFSGDFHDPLAV